MAKQQNTHAKRQRELEKKRKAEEKLAKRKVRGDRPSEPRAPEDPWSYA